jgi:hypothetical protein
MTYFPNKHKNIILYINMLAFHWINYKIIYYIILFKIFLKQLWLSIHFHQLKKSQQSSRRKKDPK